LINSKYTQYYNIFVGFLASGQLTTENGGKDLCPAAVQLMHKFGRYQRVLHQKKDRQGATFEGSFLR